MIRIFLATLAMLGFTLSTASIQQAKADVIYNFVATSFDTPADPGHFQTPFNPGTMKVTDAAFVRGTIQWSDVTFWNFLDYGRGLSWDYSCNPFGCEVPAGFSAQTLPGGLLAGDEDHLGLSRTVFIDGSGYDWQGSYSSDGFLGSLCGGRPCEFSGYWLADSSTVPVPEPFTVTLFGAGVAGLIAVRRRKTAKTA